VIEVPVDESINVTSRGAVPETGVPVNAATGAEGDGDKVIYEAFTS
jgi:hypothetical protein